MSSRSSERVDGASRTLRIDRSAIPARLGRPSRLSPIGLNHIGDIDYADGLLYVPLDSSHVDPAVGKAYAHPAVALYDARTFRYSGRAYPLRPPHFATARQIVSHTAAKPAYATVRSINAGYIASRPPSSCVRDGPCRQAGERQMASLASIGPATVPQRTDSVATPAARTRLQNIDALRGLVMVLMLLDHVRETWFVYYAVTDPVDARTILPAVGFARFIVSFCAPIFVALTGLGVYLFSVQHTAKETTRYLLTRGSLLIAFELLYLGPLYWGIVPQPTFWLQVIWCIGICMILLSGLMRLPRPALIALGLILVCCHNLLDPIRLQPDDSLFPLWAILHQRDTIALPFGFLAKTTYPILPWIGVISLGFGIGPWFRSDVAPEVRQRRLLWLGTGMIAAFLLLRFANVYGDKPWFVVDGDPVRTVLSFLSMTKYPASLLFLLPTLGGGALMLVLFERIDTSRLTAALAVFGGAPMFFYLFHLTILRIFYHSAAAIWGPNHGTSYGFDNYGGVILWYIALLVPLYLPTVWFSRLKRRRRDIAWLKYF